MCDIRHMSSGSVPKREFDDRSLSQAIRKQEGLQGRKLLHFQYVHKISNRRWEGPTQRIEMKIPERKRERERERDGERERERERGREMERELARHKKETLEILSNIQCHECRIPHITRHAVPKPHARITIHPIQFRDPKGSIGGFVEVDQSWKRPEKSTEIEWIITATHLTHLGTHSWPRSHSHTAAWCQQRATAAPSTPHTTGDNRAHRPLQREKMSLCVTFELLWSWRWLWQSKEFCLFSLLFSFKQKETVWW